jgi:hypothetical protein
MLQLMHLVFDLLQTSKRRERGLVNRRTRLEVNVLVQQTQLYSTSANDVATVCRVLASDETKDRALPGSIAAYKPDVLTRIYLQGCASEYVLSTVRLMNI